MSLLTFTVDLVLHQLLRWLLDVVASLWNHELLISITSNYVFWIWLKKLKLT